VYLTYLLSGAVSLAMIVHCIKTGRNTIWVIVLLVLMSTPFLGALVYAGVEILPGLLRSRGTRRAVRGLRTTLNPEGDLRRLENEMKVSGDVASHQRYADELVRLGRAAEGVDIYKRSLTGVFADDPKLLLGCAYAQFAAGDAPGARATLDHLIEKNPQFKSPDGHLLYARALEQEGNLEKALAEFATLNDYYPGAEAAVRYARLLKQSDRRPEAVQVLESLLERAKYAPAHYKRAQAEWLGAAEAEIRG
jgi:hypothetical protein